MSDRSVSDECGCGHPRSDHDGFGCNDCECVVPFGEDDVLDSGPVVSEVSGAAGPDVPDERRAKWGAIYFSPVIDSKAWHYDNQGDAFLTKLIEEIDAEVAAAVSGCRRDQQARDAELVKVARDLRTVVGRSRMEPTRSDYTRLVDGLLAHLAALAGEVNPE